jgi:hypothetical protein
MDSLSNNILNDLQLDYHDKYSKQDIKNNEYYNIIYNKKWLILIGFLVIGILFYIYYNDIPLSIPIISNLFNFSNIKKYNKKKQFDSDLEDNDDSEHDDSESDDKSESNYNVNDNWILEDEIKTYMEKQHEYIANLN